MGVGGRCSVGWLASPSRAPRDPWPRRRSTRRGSSSCGPELPPGKARQQVAERVASLSPPPSRAVSMPAGFAGVNSHVSNSSSSCSPLTRSAVAMNSSIVACPPRCSRTHTRSRRKNVVVADLVAQRLQRHRAAVVDRDVEQQVLRLRVADDDRSRTDRRPGSTSRRSRRSPARSRGPRPRSRATRRTSRSPR